MHHRLTINTGKLNQITGELFFEPAGHPWIRYSLTPWDKGLILNRDPHPFNPVYDDCPDLLLLDSRNKQLEQAGDIKDFISNIPSNVQDAVRPFRWKQLQLLQMIQKEPLIMEMIKSIPLLAWMLADKINNKNFDLYQAVKLASLKRKQILQNIAGKGSNAQIRFIKKTFGKNLNAEESGLLWWAVGNNKVIKKLTHVSMVNLNVLKAVLERPAVLDTPAFFLLADEINKPEGSSEKARVISILLLSCEQFRSALGDSDFNELFRNCPDLRQLHDRHDFLHQRCNKNLMTQQASITREKEACARLSEKILALEARNSHLPEKNPPRKKALPRTARKSSSTKFPSPPSMPVGCFPLPPLPGISGVIEPITTLEELKQEGKTMRNCVGGKKYIKSINSNRSYVYKVYSPERCTLELQIVWKSGKIYLFRNDLRCVANNSPGKATKIFVDNWLEKSIQELRQSS